MRLIMLLSVRAGPVRNPTHTVPTGNDPVNIQNPPSPHFWRAETVVVGDETLLSSPTTTDSAGRGQVEI
ncbi:hypothetical protein, partial [Nocardioides sp.]|uniref:hypothetical protein n=1 Tax=Nocardioides sp. TaxID=35761 RepID=UPI0025E4A894